MISTSCKQIAQHVLERAIAGDPPRQLPEALVEEPCAGALFGTLAEGLADRFDPALCDVYARLFAQAIALTVEGVEAGSLVARYERVRRPRRIAGNPRRVFVLSRVTLGADVAVTSVLLATAKSRYPDAELVFVGPEKNFELFAGDPRLRHTPVSYQRGGLHQRLAIWADLTELLSAPDAVVIDPDSRLTQLGLLPVCPEDRYHLFESRAYGGSGSGPLTELSAKWSEETFGIPGGKPYLALRPASSTNPAPYIAISLGVGENLAKRLEDPFEEELLRLLASKGMALWIDCGAGGEESARVTRAAERSGARVSFWEGSFAGFASIIQGARLYIGYDSAGQHVADACGVPLISIFAGYPVERLFDRWRPTGSKAQVIRAEGADRQAVLSKIQSLIL